MIFNKGLHCLVRSQTKAAVKLCRGAVPVFGALPEQTVVAAEERRVLHLRLVLEDGVAFEAQFLRAERKAGE